MTQNSDRRGGIPTIPLSISYHSAQSELTFGRVRNANFLVTAVRMTYDEALHFWYSRVNFEVKPPRPDDFKLDRMRLVLAHLGDPQRRLRVLHIAGSKGKGSTAAMLASILQHQGYRVGLFTSPHLVHVEERIQVNREPISRAELTALMSEIEAVSRLPMPEGGGVINESLTFFEIATALGLLHFVRRRVDWAVLEVGLGGRLDSTNVCTPVVSVITSISYDHMQMLGNTLSSIAREKAGIIKPGRPTISGVLADEARTVIEDIARERRSPLRQIQRDFHYCHTPAVIDQAHEAPARVKVTTWRRAGRTVELTLMGEHQAANAAVTLAVIETLRERGIPVHPRAIAAGLSHVHWPARMELLARKPFVLLDCAHNVASAEALLQALRESFPDVGRRALIFAGSRDKDLAGMLRVLAPHFERIFLTTFATNPRAVAPEQLAALAPADAKQRLVLTQDARAALDAAREWATPLDLICITGSVFLTGEVRPMLQR
jgi:dihydrofolate synthase/folylpolyglutamate synthase